MSRKGGHGGYDDWRDDGYSEDDDDYYDDDDDDDGFDAYDRGGGGATLAAKGSKKKPAPPPPPPKAKKAPPPAVKTPATNPAAAPKSKETAAAAVEKAPSSSSSRQPVDPSAPLAALSLTDAAAAPCSHPKELAAALAERRAKEAAAAAAGDDGLDSKPEVHVVVLGHVDAGKSTLVGRLLSDCGVVSSRDAAKIAAAASKAGKGSFSWAWMLDVTEDERQRGVTVEVGRCRVPTPKLHVTLLDAPGHSDFVPEAIGGVALADAALLVVDGSRGGFEAGFDGNKDTTKGSSSSSSSTSMATAAGQTKEHAALARALGVRELVVAVTKLDTLGYDRNRFEEIRARLGAFLSSLGFGSSSSTSGSSSSSSSSRPITWLPVAAPLGQNVSAPPTEPELLSWWSGDDVPHPTLLSALGSLSPPRRDLDSPLRLPAVEVSPRPARGGQACVLVSGKVEAGALCAGIKVVAVPPGGAAGTGRVVSVVVRGGGNGEGTTGSSSSSPSSSPSLTTTAVAGDSCEVVVSGPCAEPGVLSRGAVLCPASHPVALARKFIARIKVLDGANGGGGGSGGGSGNAALSLSSSSSSFASLSSSPGAAGIILPGSSVTLHVGASVRPATIARLVALLDPKTGEEVRKRPRLVGRGQAALVELAPESGDAVAVVVVSSAASSSTSENTSSSSSSSSLSRIALREAGKTLAVGVVVEVVE